MHLRSQGNSNLLQPLDNIHLLGHHRRVRRAVQGPVLVQEVSMDDHRAQGAAQAVNQGDNEPAIGGNELPLHEPRPPRVIGAGDAPNTHQNRYGIQPPPVNNNNFEVKPSFISMVQGDKFHGLPMEDPLDHLDNFDRVCGLIKINGVSEDAFKLRLFPFSLGDKARMWEKNLPQGTITSWEACKRAFLTKFFSTARTAKLRNEISSFTQRDNESFSEAWERFKGYTMQCPHHGFSQESLLSTIYRGVLPKIRMLLDTASNGYFLGRQVETGLELIENLALSDGNYHEDYDRAPRGGEFDAHKKEIQSLHAKLDKLMLSNQKQVTFVDEQMMVCQTHEDHQEQEELNYVGNQRNFNSGFSNNWRGNNTLSYRGHNVENPQDQVYPQPQGGPAQQRPFVPSNNQQGFQPRPSFQSNFYGNNQGGYQGFGQSKFSGPPGFTQQAPQQPHTQGNMDLMLQQFMQNQKNSDVKMRQSMAELSSRFDSSIADIANQMGSLQNKIHQYEYNKGQAPAASSSTQAPQNADGQHKDFCNVIHSDEFTRDSCDASPPDMEAFLYDDDTAATCTLLFLPTPSATTEEDQIIDTFLGNLGDDFAYNEDIAVQVGGIISEPPASTLYEEHPPAEFDEAEIKSLPKLSNPGKFSIPCTLGTLDIKDAMCDSGSSVNVISLDMVKSIGVTSIDYHPTKVTFGDGKAKQPHGMIKDYPVKVNNCLVHTDFIVMRLDKNKNLPLLLGTPFLNSVGATIDFPAKRVVLKNVDERVYYPITPPLSNHCGSMDLEVDDCEESQENARIRAHLEEEALQRRLAFMADLATQKKNALDKRLDGKMKKKGSKHKKQPKPALLKIDEIPPADDGDESLASLFFEPDDESPPRAAIEGKRVMEMLYTIHTVTTPVKQGSTTSRTHFTTQPA